MGTINFSNDVMLCLEGTFAHTVNKNDLFSLRQKAKFLFGHRPGLAVRGDTDVSIGPQNFR